MYCPFCGHVETKVTDSRLAGEGRQIRRRRECLACGERFTTFETAELVMPMVVKGDRTREPFDEAKLRAGMEKALEKRPVPRAQVDEAVSRIAHKVRALGDREVPARVIGELVMEELRQLDEVAYVRFASVYRHFQDVEAFHEEIRRLRDQREDKPPRGRPKRPARRRRPQDREQLSLLPPDSPQAAPSSDGEPAQVRRWRDVHRRLTAGRWLARSSLPRAVSRRRIRIRGSAASLRRVRQIVGEGWHERAGEPHAEVNALRRGRQPRPAARPPMSPWSRAATMAAHPRASTP